jgi:SdpI/YfhL protein family
MSYLFLVRAMTAFDQTVVAFALLAVGIIMFAFCLPLIKPKVRMNRIYGTRVRESFTSEERWLDINAYGGRQFALWSLPIVVTGIVGLLLPTYLVFIYTPNCHWRHCLKRCDTSDTDDAMD